MNGPQSQNRTDVMFNFLALSSIHFTCSEFKVNHQSGVKILTSGRVASHPVDYHFCFCKNDVQFVFIKIPELPYYDTKVAVFLNSALFSPIIYPKKEFTLFLL